MFKQMTSFVAVAVLVLALAPAAQAIDIRSDSPLVPSGLGVGDSFQLAFNGSLRAQSGGQYSDKYNVTFTHSSPVSDYDTMMQNLADNSTGYPELYGLGLTWKAIMSSTTVDARVHASLGASTPLYELDGDKIADNYADLWNGDIDTAIKRTDKGNEEGGEVLTGTNTNGTKNSDGGDGFEVGDGTNKTRRGHTSSNDSNWIYMDSDSGRNGDLNSRVYGMSDVLTVVAAPAAPTIDIGSVLVPAGLGVGDTFQLAFVTSDRPGGAGGYTVTKLSGPGVYDSIVQDYADNSTIADLANLGATWKAIVSSTEVDAKNHAVLGDSTPLYTVTGTLIATGKADLWDGANPAWNTNENGGSSGGQVITGTASDGTKSDPIGAGWNTAFRRGNTNQTDGTWINHDLNGDTNSFVYAMSEEITVIAVTFTSDGGGDWDTGSTWDQGASTPGEYHPVIVTGGDTVTADGAPDEGKSLSITGGDDSNVTVTGSLAISESVTVGDETLLIVNGTMSADEITIQGGGILAGGGAITATDPVVLQAGAALLPGSAGIVGTLNITGDLTLADGALFTFDLATVGDSDQVDLTGTLNLNGQEFADFTFNTLGGFGAGEYILFTAAGHTGSLGGSLSGDVGGLPGTLSLETGSTNVVLTVVPEPSTLVLLVSGLLALLLLARRRRK